MSGWQRAPSSCTKYDSVVHLHSTTDAAYCKQNCWEVSSGRFIRVVFTCSRYFNIYFKRYRVFKMKNILYCNFQSTYKRTTGFLITIKTTSISTRLILSEYKTVRRQRPLAASSDNSDRNNRSLWATLVVVEAFMG